MRHPAGLERFVLDLGKARIPKLNRLVLSSCGSVSHQDLASCGNPGGAPPLQTAKT